MRSGLAPEKIGLKHFSEFDNAQLCYYDVRKLERSERDIRVKGLLENLDLVIYASSSEKAFAMDTDVLS
jgi:hypothetical protein